MRSRRGRSVLSLVAVVDSLIMIARLLLLLLLLLPICLGSGVGRCDLLQREAK